MKKILILSSRIPYPLIGGDRIRIYNTGRILSRRYKVELVCVSEGKVRKEHIEKLKEIFHKVIPFSYPHLRFRWNASKGVFSKKPLQVHYYYFREIQKWVNEKQGDYDVIFANHIRTVEYLKNINCPRIVDLHDAISANYLGATKKVTKLWKVIYWMEKGRVLPYEVKTVNEFDRSFIVSDVDRNYLIQRGVAQEKIITIPVAVKDEVINRPLQVKEKNQIAFFAKLDTLPNKDAAIYFARKVLPLLRKKNRNLKFIIVGAKPPREVLGLGKIDGITVTGFMEDPYHYLESSIVFVVPMRFGAGVQNKLLEAMALRKPVVTTSLGAGAIKGEDGKHFLVADEPVDMANKILDLLEDKEKRRSLGEEARALVEKEYTWKVVGQKFLREIDKVV